MFCPKCSQQQLSESVRFCSRCGFPLEVVSELVTNDGALTTRDVQTPPVRQSSLRRKGMQEGAKLTLGGLVLTPFGYALCFVFDSVIPVMFPLTVFLAGLAWMAYHRFFGDPTALPPAPASFIETPARNFALPAERSIAASLATNTAEIGQPSSVTEHTTRLLDGE
ncbi:MAG TPA: zinc ribbon domain-containing protein [Pyrinomonadaceae bacterium]|jgi:hypothetical protein|nr:zinc ribbon domain-containing protein [Pyrinomonadaceae bacterium]